MEDKFRHTWHFTNGFLIKGLWPMGEWPRLEIYGWAYVLRFIFIRWWMKTIFLSKLAIYLPFLSTLQQSVHFSPQECPTPSFPRKLLGFNWRNLRQCSKEVILFLLIFLRRLMLQLIDSIGQGRSFARLCCMNCDFNFYLYSLIHSYVQKSRYCALHLMTS